MSAGIRFNHDAGAWKLLVWCDACTCTEAPACEECRGLLRRAGKLERLPRWRQWLIALRNDRDGTTPLIFADWLEENEWPDLATQARLTTFLWCDECRWRRKYTQLTHKGRKVMPFCPRCLGTGRAPYTPQNWSAL